jgi:hypothetical protein
MSAVQTTQFVELNALISMCSHNMNIYLFVTGGFQIVTANVLVKAGKPSGLLRGLRQGHTVEKTTTMYLGS